MENPNISPIPKRASFFDNENNIKCAANGDRTRTHDRLSATVTSVNVTTRTCKEVDALRVTHGISLMNNEMC